MANTWYPLGLKHYGQAEIAWKASGGSTIRAFLIDTANYTYSAAHEFLSSIPTNARIGNSNGTAYTDAAALTLIDAASGGVLDANDVTYTGVTASATTYEAIVIFKAGTGDADSVLLHYIDTATSGLPVTPDGNNILIQWDNGANKIAVL